jgi:hypothetical protein
MPLPPEWLNEWTKYIALLATTITAIRGLWHGGSILGLKFRQMRGGAA